MSFKENAQLRLAQQYQDSPNIQAFLNILVDEADGIAGAFDQLRLRLDIDQSIGKQLDGIGEIVGKARPGTDPSEDEAFAFATGPGLGFGTKTGPTIGGKFGSLSDIYNQLVLVSDETYRKYLRAAIWAAQSHCTVEEIGAFINFVFAEQVFVLETVGSVSIYFNRTLETVENELLAELTPVPAGIALQIFESWSTLTITLNNGYYEVTP